MSYSKEDLEKIKEMFDFLDKNKQGAISFEDFNLGIIGLGGELTTKEINIIKNQKEIFDLNDFISICQQKRININELENKLLLAFSLLETDKKGYVPSSSLITLLKSDKVPDKEIQQLIYEAKPDSYNNIDYRKFVKEMLGANPEDEDLNNNNNYINNYNNNYNNNKDSDNEDRNYNNYSIGYNNNNNNNNNEEDNSDY